MGVQFAPVIPVAIDGFTTNVDEGTDLEYDTTTVFEIDEYVFSDTTGRRYKVLQAAAATSLVETVGGTDTINWTGHTLSNGDSVRFDYSSLTSGVTPGQRYYVINSVFGVSFQISTTSGGSAFDIPGSTVPNGYRAYGPLNANQALPAIDEENEWFIEAGPTNKTAAFDGTGTVPARRLETITYTIPVVDRYSMVALINMRHVVTVEVTAGDYNETFDLTDNSFADNWYTYLHSPLIFKRDLFIDNIPPEENMTLEVTLTGPEDKIIEIGEIAFGLAFDLGGVNYGVTTSRRDFSSYEKDKYGKPQFVKRVSFKRNEGVINMPNHKIAAVDRLLDDYRTQPCLWKLTEDYANTWIYGWNPSLSIRIPYPDYSECAITVEEL